MKALLTSLCSTLLIGWVAIQAMNAAKATIVEHQERQAEALCQIDQSYCANR